MYRRSSDEADTVFSFMPAESDIFLLHRYQFFLQVKQDILQGRLPVSFDLAAELGAYVVQCKNIFIFNYCVVGSTIFQKID